MTPSEKGYVLKVVKPFWQDEQWQQAWQQRKATTTETKGSTPHKNTFWREKYTTLISETKTLQGSSPKTEESSKGEVDDAEDTPPLHQESKSKPG